MTIHVRNKGHNGEREFCKKLEAVLGRTVARNVDQVRDGGADIIDVPPYAIEVKRQESLNLNGWWKQALSQRTSKCPIAVLVWRQNNARTWNVRIEADYIIKKKMRVEGAWVQVSLETFMEWVGRAPKGS